MAKLGSIPQETEVAAYTTLPPPPTVDGRLAVLEHLVEQNQLQMAELGARLTAIEGWFIGALGAVALLLLSTFVRYMMARQQK